MQPGPDARSGGAPRGRCSARPLVTGQQLPRNRGRRTPGNPPPRVLPPPVCRGLRPRGTGRESGTPRGKSPRTGQNRSAPCGSGAPGRRLTAGGGGGERPPSESESPTRTAPSDIAAEGALRGPSRAVPRRRKLRQGDGAGRGGRWRRGGAGMALSPYVQAMQELFRANTRSREFPAHGAKVHSVAWSCCGRRLASGSFDKTASVFLLEKDRLVSGGSGPGAALGAAGCAGRGAGVVGLGAGSWELEAGSWELGPGEETGRRDGNGSGMLGRTASRHR